MPSKLRWQFLRFPTETSGAEEAGVAQRINVDSVVPRVDQGPQPLKKTVGALHGKLTLEDGVLYAQAKILDGIHDFLASAVLHDIVGHDEMHSDLPRIPFEAIP